MPGSEADTLSSMLSTRGGTDPYQVVLSRPFFMLNPQNLYTTDYIHRESTLKEAH